jgi:hypothetical protein
VSRELCVANRVLNVLVAHVELDGTGVVAVIGELVAAGMPQHVRVDAKGQLGGNAGALDHLQEPFLAERRPPLAYEHVAVLRLLAQQLAQRPQLLTADRVDALDAVLDPVDVKLSALEVMLLPPELAHVCRSQSVPIRHQDHSRITVAVPVLAGGLHQLLHFTRREIFTGAQVAVGPPDRNCPIFSVWGVSWHRGKTLMDWDDAEQDCPIYDYCSDSKENAGSAQDLSRRALLLVVLLARQRFIQSGRRHNRRQCGPARS